MTAEPDLPINDAVPAPTKIEPGNLFLWNWRQMQVYAQACVAHATAARDAEIEALRAEVERLRAIAGCAYQMAGMHDAPEVWLDRLSEASNGAALPDADTLMDELLPYQPDAVCEAEARAERLAEALQDAREFVAEMLSDERAKFAGYEAISDIARIEATLQKIDTALAQEARNG